MTRTTTTTTSREGILPVRSYSSVLKRRRRRRRNRRSCSTGQKAFVYQHVAVVFASAFWLWSSVVSSEDTKKGYLDVERFCRKTYVTVSSVYLTCDSPGAYYYGSNTYRDSVVCMSSDKANLELELTISDDIEGGYVYIQVESGLYDSFATVIEPTEICSIQSMQAVQSDSNSTHSCPETGDYGLSTYFYVPQITDYGFHYTPDIRITFSDEDGRRLGCASTGTVAILNSADAKATRGLIALGISLVAFMFIFAVLLYFSYRRKKRLEKLSQQRSQRYHYFRTLPTGQVVPLPGQSLLAPGRGSTAIPAGLPPSHQQPQHPYGGRAIRGMGAPGHHGHHAPAAASGQAVTGNIPPAELRISNPSYNEPQIPITRPPII